MKDESKSKCKGSCYYCSYYVRPTNKAGVEYDSCCFQHELNFKKKMEGVCDLFRLDYKRGKEETKAK